MTVLIQMDHWVQILEKTYPNPKTRDNYLSRLRGMLGRIGNPSLTDVLHNPDVYYPNIKQAYTNITTRKNMLTVILALFREDEGLRASHATQHAQWKKLHDDLTKLQEAKIKRSEPEDKQVAKYTSFEEIEEKYEDMRKKAPHGTERASMQYVLLSILVHLRPKRADLGAVRVYTKDPRKTDENYIVMKDGLTSYLVMNLYKTSKYYQTVEEDLPEGLVRDIKASLTRWPREYLFRTDEGKPMSNNTYSVFVKTTFQGLFGRSTGVSLLRHIYITEKLNFDDMTLEEQDEEAKLMLHTSGLQRQYKWPKKVLCPKLCAPYIQTHLTRKKGKGDESKGKSKGKTNAVTAEENTTVEA